MNIPEKIKELESINESHRKLNGELRERIKGLEELILTKEEACYICLLIADAKDIVTERELNLVKSIIDKLQKIIGGD